MLYMGVQSSKRPDRVLVEQLPDGTKNVRLTDHVTIEEDGETINYLSDEVVFQLTADRIETEQDIEAAFSDWWAFGCQPEEPDPTMEERVSILEDVILELLG